MPCSFETAQRFEGMHQLHPQGQSRHHGEQLSLLPASAGFLLGLLFIPRDEGNTLLQNTGLSELHGIASQKTVLFRVIILRTSNPIHLNLQRSDQFQYMIQNMNRQKDKKAQQK
jgi:hypothetical protein